MHDAASSGASVENAGRAMRGTSGATKGAGRPRAQKAEPYLILDAGPPVPAVLVPRDRDRVVRIGRGGGIVASFRVQGGDKSWRAAGV